MDERAQHKLESCLLIKIDTTAYIVTWHHRLQCQQDYRNYEQQNQIASRLVISTGIIACYLNWHLGLQFKTVIIPSRIVRLDSDENTCHLLDIKWQGLIVLMTPIRSWFE